MNGFSRFEMSPAFNYPGNIWQTGPKTLDTNYDGQPTLWLYNPCLQVLAEHWLLLFLAKAFHLFILFLSCTWHCSRMNPVKVCSYYYTVYVKPLLEPTTFPFPTSGFGLLCHFCRLSRDLCLFTFLPLVLRYNFFIQQTN